ncbi:OmpP1/FadL family transporter [Phocaeicola salanitronis]|uniref:OmpP1/FadL family transporter n=1 Tax=Phocaeicola salanitronis TaxID=376805 RepID=UPI003208AE8D
MLLRNKILLTAVLTGSWLTATAQLTPYPPQSSTNSPYTRYGLGELSDRGFANNAAMGGVGYGLRYSGHINLTNPAAYSSVDSLSFMFDIGMSLKSSNYKENGISSNAKNASFDYLAIQFRLHKRLGMAIGFTPYSTVGYNFSTTSPVSGSEDVTATNTFQGDGGLQQVTAGLGFKILDNLSIGASAGYIYGSLSYQNMVAFNTNSDATYVYNTLKIKSYVADFGLQYTQKINKTDYITLGLVYGLGHTLNSTDTRGIRVTDNLTNPSYSSVNEHKIKNAYGIPHTFGVGLSYLRNNRLTIAADYTLQKWSSAKYYTPSTMYKDRSKIALGAEILPNPIGRNYLQRIRYRIGANYATPYLNLPQCEGPSEYSISAGFGFPLYLFQRNTILNLTGQYIRVNPSTSNMLSENRFVIKLGLTFNEHWFMKWKVN